MNLIRSVNWLSIKELVFYHTMIMAWKVIKLQTPVDLASKITINQDNTVQTHRPRLINTIMRLRWRICQGWNQLPVDLREINSLPRFKLRIKAWIKSTRVPDPGPGPGQETED